MNSIVPAAAAHKLPNLLEAIDFHISENCKKSKKNSHLYRSGVMIEYILIKGK